MVGARGAGCGNRPDGPAAAFLGVEVDGADNGVEPDEVGLAPASSGTLSEQTTIGTKTKPGWPVAMILRHSSASDWSQQTAMRTARGHLLALRAVAA